MIFTREILSAMAIITLKFPPKQTPSVYVFKYNFYSMVYQTTEQEYD